MLNAKATIVLLTVGLITNSQYKCVNIFQNQDLQNEKLKSNYATKEDLKNATGAHTSRFAKEVDLASLKSNVDKLDTDKLKNVLSGLSSLKSKVDKLHVDKLVPIPVDLS